MMGLGNSSPFEALARAYADRREQPQQQQMMGPITFEMLRLAPQSYQTPMMGAQGGGGGFDLTAALRNAGMRPGFAREWLMGPPTLSAADIKVPGY